MHRSMKEVANERFQKEKETVIINGEDLSTSKVNNPENIIAAKEKQAPVANITNIAKEDEPINTDIETNVDKLVPDKIDKGINFEYIPESVYEHLPSLLKTSCSTFTKREERDVYLTGALSVLSGCLYNVYAYNDVDKKGVSPNLLSFIVAPPASGKGVLRYAKMLANKVKVTFADSIPHKKNECPRLIIPANISTSGLIELLNQNNGVGILIESEIDTLLNAHKNEWGDYSDILRNSFENESSSQYRKTDKQYAEVPNIKLAMVISGTNNQFKNLMKSAENGLFSRGCYYIFDNDDDVLQCFGRLKTDKDIEEHFEEYSKTFNEYYLKVMKFDFVKIVFSNDQLQKLQGELQKEFDHIYGFKEIEANVKRAFIYGQKIASIISCLVYCEKDTLSQESACIDSMLDTAIDLMKVYLRHSYKAYELLPKKDDFDLKINQQRLFLALPTEFKRGDAIALADSLGVSVKTIDNAIKLFKDKQMIEELKFGKFRKNQKLL